MNKVFFFILLYSFILIFIFELIGQVLRPNLPYQYTPQKIIVDHFDNHENTEFTLKKNFKGRFLYSNASFDVMVKTNSLGMRDTELDDREKFFIYGDSFIFGFGVENNQTIPAHIENLFNKQFDFVNMGYYSGRSPDSYLNLIRHNLEFQNKNNILFLYENDMKDIFNNRCLNKNKEDVDILDKSCFKIESKTTFVIDGKILQYKETVLRNLPPFVFIILKKSYSVGIIRFYYNTIHDFFKKPDPINYSEIGKLCSIISEIKSYSKSLKVFNVPAKHNSKNKNFYYNLLSCLKKKNIKHFIVNTLGDHYYFKNDAHFNSTGTIEYSKRIFTILKEHL